SSGLVGEGGGAVAQVVEPDRWDVDLAEEQPEAATGVAGVDRGAVFADEHVAGVLPGLAGGDAAGALLGLSEPVLTQDLDGVLVEGDGARASGGFGWPSDDPVAGGGAVTDDEQYPAVEVEVGPAQATGLAAAKPA